MNVPSLQPQNESQPDEQTLSQYAEHTRKSLIARLENWEDQRTWDEFYRTYWRLIYSVALKAGLREDEAWDVVQETILSIAKQSKKNIYKPEQGSFKLWLWNMTRWRINDPVSYTHLRAHETRHDLVCRLLLEKKKKQCQF